MAGGLTLEGGLDDRRSPAYIGCFDEHDARLIVTKFGAGGDVYKLMDPQPTGEALEAAERQRATHSEGLYWVQTTAYDGEHITLWYKTIAHIPDPEGDGSR